ncbi:MAG: hypothetical protein LBR85_00900 [Oscillospiraceae bacterium]|jgi:flavodoxin|nr:hypothetical protein [Oscillospiraceae bacterium]
MKTLVVCYSKTGTTAKVAKDLVKGKDFDYDELKYDEGAKTTSHTRNPAEYERVILLSPVWAFSLSEPMTQYIFKNKAGIKRYDLVVTCGLMGLRGCVRKCASILGRPPEKTLKLKSKNVQAGNFDVSGIV